LQRPRGRHRGRSVIQVVCAAAPRVGAKRVGAKGTVDELADCGTRRRYGSTFAHRVTFILQDELSLGGERAGRSSKRESERYFSAYGFGRSLACRGLAEFCSRTTSRKSWCTRGSWESSGWKVGEAVACGKDLDPRTSCPNAWRADEDHL
jgi:hypothetical protein